MNTPVCDFLREYATQKSCRLHMPGHKGLDLEFCDAKYDITEIDGADVLYSPRGIILESERNAKELFGTEKTVYSTEGSSLSIKAMIYMLHLYSRQEGRKAKILATRNAHKSFINAVALVDIDVEFIYSESKTIISSYVNGSDIRKAINEMDEPPVAVYLTSPDYLGNMLDIGEIARVCHENGVLLLVDNAHGGYLSFLNENQHPIFLGADVCCDSAHKTLPALTGAGYLHVSKTAPSIFSMVVNEAMALFASTSPSYLILASLDELNVKLSTHFKESLNSFVPKVTDLKKKLRGYGYNVLSGEMLKIALMPKEYGYTGTELASILYNKGIVCEFYDEDYVVLMLSQECEGVLNLIDTTLSGIERKAPIITHAPTLMRPKRAMSIREAIMSPSREVPVDTALSHVIANPTVSCPPAIPILVSGEIVDESSIQAFKYYGIEKVRIVERNS